MSEKEKPDGWVAWHPRGQPTQARFYTFHWDEEMCKHKLTDVFRNKKIHEEKLKRKLARGWRIRPVKLVFLEEDK